MIIFHKKQEGANNRNIKVNKSVFKIISKVMQYLSQIHSTKYTRLVILR